MAIYVMTRAEYEAVLVTTSLVVLAVMAFGFLQLVWGIIQIVWDWWAERNDR
jgi:uncharacterized ion transporter superfamily protein YfcC